MFKIIKVLNIILISLLLCELNFSANAEDTNGKNFMLPKTFKINDEFLPPLNASSTTKQSKTLSTETNAVNVNKSNSVTTSTVNKTMQTVKTNNVGTSAQVKNKVPAVYKQPTAIITTTPSNNNSAKSTVVRTNAVKPVTVNKSNNLSLTNLIKNYDCDYADTLKSTIISLSTMGITTSSYNTDKGQISAFLPSGKEIFILVVPFDNNSTYVRITPADGTYNLPMTTINTIFSNIQDNLSPN